MNLDIQVKDLEVDERLQQQITQKVGRLDKRIKGITSALVELSLNNSRRKENRFVAEVTLDVSGSVLRAQEKAGSVTEAVTSVIDALDRRIERLKYKVYRSGQSRKVAQHQLQRGPAPADVDAEEDGLGEDGIGSAKGVVRVKRYPIKPMTLDEAAFQMELSGHDFFLFFDSEERQYNLLYKRQDGDYGLIQPEPM